MDNSEAIMLIYTIYTCHTRRFRVKSPGMPLYGNWNGLGATEALDVLSKWSAEIGGLFNEFFSHRQLNVCVRVWYMVR
jgi:hypothetical protein